MSSCSPSSPEAGVFGLSRANFVGVNDEGLVAVYQGVPWNLPFGIHLYREVYASPLLAAELSRADRRKLLDHTLRERGPSQNEIDGLARYVVGGAMSYRNRELMSLLVVGLITGFGFASVYIARQDVISTSSLSYGIFFLCLYLVAHVFTRVTVPNADPYVLPLGGLLTAIGVTEIYRINPEDALRQSLWIVIGLAVFAATLFVLRRDYRDSRATSTSAASARSCSSYSPRCRHRPEGERRPALDPRRRLQIQPGEFAKLLLIVFLAGYLREKREVPRAGQGSRTSARCS